MAELVSTAHNYRQPQLAHTCSANSRLASEITSRFRANSPNYVTFGYYFGMNRAHVGTSQRHDFVEPLVSRRHIRNAITCRAGAQDKYGHCKCTEDAVMAIMKDAIQHCLNTECDVMRDKVLEQMGQGLAALCRVSVGHVAAESPIPIPVPDQFSSIKEEDLEQVRRMLHLTSLPFNTTEDEDLKRLMKILQTGNGEDIRRTLSGSDLSQICERLGSDLVQCLGPLIMCFPELPLWAKHRALLLPAEMAGKVAFSLLTGPNGRL